MGGNGYCTRRNQIKWKYIYICIYLYVERLRQWWWSRTSSVSLSPCPLVVSPAWTRVPEVLRWRNHLQVVHRHPGWGLFAARMSVCIDRLLCCIQNKDKCHILGWKPHTQVYLIFMYLYLSLLKKCVYLCESLYRAWQQSSYTYISFMWYHYNSKVLFVLEKMYQWS